MAITGVRSSTNFATDQKKTGYLGLMLETQIAGDTPLTYLSTMTKKKTPNRPDFFWYEEVESLLRFPLHATSGDLTTTNQTLVLASTSPDARQLKENDLLLVEQTHEILRVVGTPSSATGLTVERAASGSTAATLDANGSAINPNLLLIGSAFPESSDAPAGHTYVMDKITNYCQIFRDTFQVSNTSQAVKLETASDVAYNRTKKFREFNEKIERAFLFGKPHEDTSGGQPRRTTGGVYHYVNAYSSASNIQAISGGTSSMSTFEGHMKAAFQWGSDEKVALAGDDFLLGVNQLVRKNSHYQLSPLSKEYGLNVRRLTSPFGELVLIRSKVLNKSTGGNNGASAYVGRSSWGMILDMEQIAQAHLRPIKEEKELQLPGVDGKSEGWIGELGLVFGNPRNHYIITGLTGGVVDS